MRNRIAVGMCAVLIVGAAILLVASRNSSGNTEGPARLAELNPVVETTTTTTTPLSPAQEAELDKVRTEVTEAIRALLAADSVMIRYRGVHGSMLEGTAEVDLHSGDYRQSEVETHENGGVVSSEHVLVGDVLHVRFHHGEGSIDDVSFASVDAAGQRDEFAREVLTMSGRAGASMDRLIRYVEEIPFEAQQLEPTVLDGRPVTGYQVRFDAAAVSSFLRHEALELVGSRDPDGSTFYEFWIDESDGQLVKLALGGVHFQDGEALEGLGGELLYVPGGRLSIAPPGLTG